MPQDLNRSVNEWLRSVDQYVRKSAYGLLVIFCLIATAISWARAERAIDAANAANATSITTAGRLETELQGNALEFDRELRRSDEQWSGNYSKMERECRLWQNDVQGYVMDMVEAGIPMTHGKKQ